MIEANNVVMLPVQRRLTFADALAQVRQEISELAREYGPFNTWPERAGYAERVKVHQSCRREYEGFQP
jgi:hypothetical protein